MNQPEPPPFAAAARSAYHVMTKPIGPVCNLDCKYCFYLEKENLFPKGEKFRMSDEVLEAYVRQYIESQTVPEISFAWQGGEPTLMGVEFFRKVVALQAKYADGKQITNAFQTNGTLLDDEWCGFLGAHNFLVGLSVDGPRELHDYYRVDKGQRPTFERVMHGLELLKKHSVEFNTLTVVNRRNSKQPLEVYRFLREIGSGFIQFIPLVERTADPKSASLGLDLAMPPVFGGNFTSSPKVTEWSVEPRQYGEFLTTIFDEWVRRDVGRVFVQMFDIALGQWAGAGSGLCVFSEKCGSAMAMEHNGDIYSCDHYVYPQYKLGNLLNESLDAMARGAQQQTFGNEKLTTLPRYCMECPVRFACNGECPKHRFLFTPDGEPGLNYLCAGYKRFFAHVDPYMKAMTALLQERRAPAEIMEMIARDAKRRALQTADRNELCPCGSGRKYKKCCGHS